MRRALAAAALLAGVSCHAPRFLGGGPRLSGTCEGACDHYLECRGGANDLARTSCVADCHDVFADQESLRAFESLSCRDAVEYVDGARAQRASR